MLERLPASITSQFLVWLRMLWEKGVHRIQTYPLWERYALPALLLLASWLNFKQLIPITAGNTYYAAAIKSMLTSWHAFFFTSFDPVGFVSVDKPPLGLWIQTISAKIFDFNNFSLLLPEALAGVISVVLLYHLVRRTFGGVAALLAGFLLAISPINVVANRDNIFEAPLLLLALVAAWATMKATETGTFRWLALCGLCIGLAFNIKMLEAYLILPSCLLTFFVAAPLSLRQRLKMLAGMGIIILVVSFWWVAAVDLTPAAQRPYVDSTFTNSELELVFNYNGVQRLFGQPTMPISPNWRSPMLALPVSCAYFSLTWGDR